MNTSGLSLPSIENSTILIALASHSFFSCAVTTISLLKSDYSTYAKITDFLLLRQYTENVQPVTLFWPDPPGWSIWSFSGSPPGNPAFWKGRTACSKRVHSCSNSRLVTVLKRDFKQINENSSRSLATGFNICFWQFYGRFVSVWRQLTVDGCHCSIITVKSVKVTKKGRHFLCFSHTHTHVHIVCSFSPLIYSFKQLKSARVRTWAPLNDLVG